MHFLERLPSELDGHSRSGGDVRSGDRSLLAGYAAADWFEFEPGILSDFNRVANGLADKRWDFDAALLDIEDDRAGYGELRLISFSGIWLLRSHGVRSSAIGSRIPAWTTFAFVAAAGEGARATLAASRLRSRRYSPRRFPEVRRGGRACRRPDLSLLFWTGPATSRAWD